MPGLLKDYLRFPSIDHFEQMLYAVAYSSRARNIISLLARLISAAEALKLLHLKPK